MFGLELKNKNTTITAFISAAIALLTAILAFADGDPETIADWNMIIISAITLVNAIGNFFAKDADKTGAGYKINF